MCMYNMYNMDLTNMIIGSFLFIIDKDHKISRRNLNNELDWKVYEKFRIHLAYNIMCLN